MSCVAATLERAKLIGGYMSDDELLWLATQALRYNKIVEYGSLHGRSTRAMADNNVGTIWAVDPWAGDYQDEGGGVVSNFSTYVYPYFYMNLKDHIDKGHVIPVREFSYRFSLTDCVDMVFIDGDHRYETVVKDIKKASELLCKGGLLCGHDYGHPRWPGVKQAVDELLGPDIKVEETIWWTLKY